MEIKIGKIVGTHGIRGEVKVSSNSDYKNVRFAKNKIVILKQYNLELKIVNHRVHKNHDLLTFENYTNINDVLIFKNHDLYQVIDDFSQEEKNDLKEYHVLELIGKPIYNFENQNEYISKITEISFTKAHPIIHFKYKEKEILVPFNDYYFPQINKEQCYLKIIEGLL